MESTEYFGLLLPEDGEVDMEEGHLQVVSYTYRIDWEAGRIRGWIDGIDSIQQAVNKLMRTPAGVYPIYQDQYGFFYQDLIGKDMDIVKSELKRRLKTAILADERVAAIDDFVLNEESGSLYVSFTVKGATGEDTLVEERIEGLS